MIFCSYITNDEFIINTIVLFLNQNNVSRTKNAYYRNNKRFHHWKIFLLHKYHTFIFTIGHFYLHSMLFDMKKYLGDLCIFWNCRNLWGHIAIWRYMSTLRSNLIWITYWAEDTYETIVSQWFFLKKLFSTEFSAMPLYDPWLSMCFIFHKFCLYIGIFLVRLRCISDSVTFDEMSLRIALYVGNFPL